MADQSYNVQRSGEGGEEMPRVNLKKPKIEMQPLEIWNDECRFTLINEVMAQPTLWNIDRTSFRDTQAATLLWQKVAEAVNVKQGTTFDVHAVKKQTLKTLRDTFVKNNKRLKATTRSSSDDIAVIRWKFFVPMQFLLGTLDTGKRFCNVGSSGADKGSSATAIAALDSPALDSPGLDSSPIAGPATTDSNLGSCAAGSQDGGTLCGASSDADDSSVATSRLGTAAPPSEDIQPLTEATTLKKVFPRRKRSSAAMEQDKAMMKLCETLETLQKRRQEERDRELEKEKEKKREKDEYEALGEYIVSTASHAPGQPHVRKGRERKACTQGTQ